MAICKEILDELMASCAGSEDLLGPDGLLKQLKVALAEPVALIGAPPPLRTFAERRRALLQRTLSPSRARIQLDPEPVSLHGRAREPMSFWDTESLRGPEQDPQ